jgi:hypothetical protein
VSDNCSSSFTLFLDPIIIIGFNLVNFVVPMCVMEFIEDKQSLGREDFSCPHFLVPLFCSGNEFRGFSMKKNGGEKGLFNVT